MPPFCIFSSNFWLCKRFFVKKRTILREKSFSRYWFGSSGHSFVNILKTFVGFLIEIRRFWPKTYGLMIVYGLKFGIFMRLKRLSARKRGIIYDKLRNWRKTRQEMHQKIQKSSQWHQNTSIFVDRLTFSGKSWAFCHEFLQFSVFI